MNDLPVAIWWRRRRNPTPSFKFMSLLWPVINTSHSANEVQRHCIEWYQRKTIRTNWWHDNIIESDSGDETDGTYESSLISKLSNYAFNGIEVLNYLTSHCISCEWHQGELNVLGIRISDQLLWSCFQWTPCRFRDAYHTYCINWKKQIHIITCILRVKFIQLTCKILKLIRKCKI